MNAEIMFDGKMYALCPTFEALSQLEHKLATGITALTLKLLEGTITLEELVLIITQCIEPKLPESVIRDALLRSGFTQIVQAVAAMFALIFTGIDTPAVSILAMNRQELLQMSTQFSD